MRRFARIAVGLAVALGGGGCQVMRPATLDPAMREQVRQGPPVHVYHYVPKPLDYLRSALEPSDVYYGVRDVDDPVADVERAFLDALRAEPGMSNLVPSDRPMWSQRRMLPRGVTWERASGYGALMTDWPDEWYRDGFAIELETLAWQIDGSGLKRLAGKCTLLFGLRARLVRLADGTVPWRAFCRLEHGGRCSELVADDLKRVKELRRDFSRRCAAELAASFTGRTEGASRDGEGPEASAAGSRPGP